MMEENSQDPSQLMTIKERIVSGYATKELSDCQFSVGAEETLVNAHKYVMSLSSPVFKAMFHGGLAETGTVPIRVTDIEPDAFNSMLQFMYTDKVDFASPKHAALVLRAAQKYIVPHLVTMCKDHIKNTLNVTTAFDLYEFAGSNNMEDVSDVCLTYFKSNTSAVVTDEKFLDADVSFVKLIVQQNELNIWSEFELLKAVDQWAVREAGKREITLESLLPELEDVISSIRFMTMSWEDLKSCVQKSCLISNEEKLALTMNKIDSGMFPYPQRFSRCAEARSYTIAYKWTLTDSLDWTLRTNIDCICTLPHVARNPKSAEQNVL